MEIVLIVIKQVAVMFLLMGIGFYTAKTKMLTQESARNFSGLLLTIVMPALLIRAYQQDFNPNKLKGLMLAFALAIVFHIIAIAVSHFLVKKREGNAYRVEILAAVYSNCGFMGVPLLQATLGDDGVFYGAAFIGVFNVLTWTHGVMTLTAQKRIKAKNLLGNPAMIGLTIGLVLFFTGLRLPGVLGDTVSFVADLNTPLAMIITGVFLSQVNFKVAVTDSKVYFSTMIRLVLLPLIMLVLLKCLPIASMFPGADTAAFSHIIACACPTAASSVLLISKLGYDSTHGAEILAVSTLLSMLTLPLFVLLFSIVPPLVG
ncbi:hypothetical protein EDD70_2555 [Hydrogenoanaerobacterium saccharovorans]|uniref:Permease n=1 Tax=Hydrogenoanaerobacterium saccharovorans TaxID=474960 RepID=A0A1H8DHN6_9FIRM|nr:AEC family transporter [Hydrogenoanaerobacterium saccharovorans]RPF42216.1 hypothetical protein EDD70_2555 [Hydrogenoanaerobacterium saccharovorans]SEN06821.1 hypothetical protein SAMN05216180_2616 [Hydrogenoanaerobacterium saccharovorans]